MTIKKTEPLTIQRREEEEREGEARVNNKVNDSSK